MSERDGIADLLHRAYEGPAWHGPALRELLESVTPSQAAARPVRSAHSIWEIALHIGVYEDEVRRRLEGEPARDLPEAEEWPKVGETTPAAWRQALARLEEGHLRLRQAVSSFPESRLGEVLPGGDYSFYVMLHGAVAHDLYHGGQIALLMRAQGIRPREE